MLTDSGGYQIYSLAENRKISPEGVTFQSHIDGSRHQFTPESAIDIQRALGADIIMAFDECTPYPCPEDYAMNSLKITHEWLSRCIKRFDETECPHGYQQNLFPIVQGSVYPSLRAESAEYIAKQNAVGNAIGGLSVGEPEELMYSMTDLVCKILPIDKPRYLMGVGTPVNLLESISLGIDMFDCVIPTRNGRNGWLYTRNGILNMKNEKWKDDFSVIDPEGDCFVDHFYTKAYLRHLFVAGEILASMIASLHNLRFYLKLMEDSREMINQGQFTEWKNQLIPKLKQRL
jgi:queuine tRNA-ribosyltransferase